MGQRSVTRLCSPKLHSEVSVWTKLYMKYWSIYCTIPNWKGLLCETNQQQQSKHGRLQPNVRLARCCRQAEGCTRDRGSAALLLRRAGGVQLIGENLFTLGGFQGKKRLSARCPQPQEDNEAGCKNWDSYRGSSHLRGIIQEDIL